MPTITQPAGGARRPAPYDAEHEAMEAGLSAPLLPQPPPGYPQVTVQPGSAALVLPGLSSPGGSPAAEGGSRGLGNVLDRPIAELGERLERLAQSFQVHLVNALHRAGRGAVSGLCAGLGGASLGALTLWWGCSLSMGFSSPINPDGVRHLGLGLAMVLTTVPPLPLLPLAGVGVGLLFGRLVGRLWLPELSLPAASAAGEP